MIKRALVAVAACFFAFAASATNFSQFVEVYKSASLRPSTTGAYFYDFVATPSIPGGWTYTKSQCSGSFVCDTNAQYTDAPAAAYSQFGTGVAQLSSTLGLGMFAGRTNNLLNSGNTGASATTGLQTTASLGTGYYVLFCNGTGSVVAAANTATLVVNSGSLTISTCQNNYTNIQVTVAGTVNVTLSGSVNWADLQTCDSGTTTFCAPIPHIITNGTTHSTVAAKLLMSGTPNTIMGTNLGTAIVEFTQYSPSQSGNNTVMGAGSTGFSLLAGSTSVSVARSLSNNTNAAVAPAGASLLTLSRIGGVSRLGRFIGALNGIPMKRSIIAPLQSNTSYYLGPDTSNTAANVNGWLSKVAVYPIALTQAQLDYMTTVGVTLP